jgi:hypothetical protein
MTFFPICKSAKPQRTSTYLPKALIRLPAPARPYPPTTNTLRITHMSVSPLYMYAASFSPRAQTCTAPLSSIHCTHTVIRQNSSVNSQSDCNSVRRLHLERARTV